MWPRTVETMLGIWLILSPLMFTYKTLSTWASDLISGFLVITFALLSFTEKGAGAHFLNILVALWLITVGYLTSLVGETAYNQNSIVVGLLILTFAILPNHINRPPQRWSKSV